MGGPWRACPWLPSMRHACAVSHAAGLAGVPVHLPVCGWWPWGGNLGVGWYEYAWYEYEYMGYESDTSTCRVTEY